MSGWSCGGMDETVSSFGTLRAGLWKRGRSVAELGDGFFCEVRRLILSTGRGLLESLRVS